jgi:hypothetical protein
MESARPSVLTRRGYGSAEVSLLMFEEIQAERLAMTPMA